MPKPQITIIGHVGRDPKPTTTKAGTPVATFPVAEDHWRWDGRMRQWERTGTSWFHVTCRWGLSEHVAESIKKGHPVVVVGKLKIAEWFDSNAVKQVTAEIDATSVGHDLRRGTVKFAKVERASTTAPPEDEDAEIRENRDEPPAEPPDPWRTTADGAGSSEPPEPPADDPVVADDDAADATTPADELADLGGIGSDPFASDQGDEALQPAG